MIGVSIKFLIAMCLAALAVQAAQAADEPAELKGSVVKIQDIVQDVASYEGKMVVVQGKIDMECGSGCWLVVNDGTAQIYIDILPSNFVIPQKRGSQARVYGKVITQDGDPAIIGKMVEIDGQIYRYEK